MTLRILKIAGVLSLSLSLAAVAAAQTMTAGGSQTGIHVRSEFSIHQNEYPEPNDATDLHFKAWQKEDNINVNGWLINISNFTNSTSQRGNQPDPPGPPDNGQHAVDVVADGALIDYCTYVDVDVDFWLTDYNTIRLSDVNWTQDLNVAQAVPDFGWTVDPPQPAAGQYVHTLTITNDDPTDSFWLTDIKALFLDAEYDDLSLVDFGNPRVVTLPDPSSALGPGDSVTLDVPTLHPNYGSHIYHTFTMRSGSSAGPIDLISTSDHLINVSNSGVPTLGQTGLTVLVLLLLLAAAVVVRRRSRAAGPSPV